MRRFAAILHTQLEQNGDPRLAKPENAAATFAGDMLRKMTLFDRTEGNAVDRILNSHGISKEMVTDAMTVADVGELAIYVRRLSELGERLHPRAKLTAQTVPPETLRSYALERNLSHLQREAPRVSGSDLGDGCIVPLVFYADGVEVDKRTCHHLRRIQRGNPAIAGLMQHFFRQTTPAFPTRWEAGCVSISGLHSGGPQKLLPNEI